MNEITRIHLAKTPYDIELGAKKELEKYVDEIVVTMQADDDAQREIEARMVELLAERGVAANQVVTKADVVALREQLGDPNAFAGDEAKNDATERQLPEEKPVKRFMRDVDHAVFGGVCAGIAEYFAVDVLLVRLLTLAAFIVSAGSLVLVYILFWIITPPARTAAEKLTMAGKPVTLEALKDSAERDKTATLPTGVKIGRVLLGVSGLVVMSGLLVGLFVGGFLGYDAVNWIDGFSMQPWAYGMLAALFTGGVALIGLVGLLSASAFVWKVTKPVGIAMIVMLAVGLVAVTAIGITAPQMARYADQDRQHFTKTETITLPASAGSIKTVNVIGATMTYGRKVAGEPVSAELSYVAIPGAATPEVRAEQHGDVLDVTVTVTNQRDCPLILRRTSSCSGLAPTVTVYGIAPQPTPVWDQWDQNDER